MNFSTPEKIASIIEDLKRADQLRAPYRALIDGLFNGDPPYTPEEERENRIQVNVNFKEAPMLLLQARQQFENAFLSTKNFFTVVVPDAPPSKATKINGIITRETNRVFKRSRPYLHTMREKFGSVALHGIGPLMWPDEYSPVPYFVPVEDILVPTDTLITLENLTHFAVRRRMTPAQLFRKTIAKGENVDPGWRLETVRRILEKYKDLNQNQNNLNWFDHPEKLAEVWKQNQTYYDSDATPVVRFWDFYFQEQMQAKTCWYRVMMLDDDCVPGASRDTNDPLDFVYQKEQFYVEHIDEVLQVQFGDGNNKPPFMWNSVRGLGFMLFDVCHMMNRLRCQFTQKVHEDLMNLFRVLDPADRSRLDRIYMGLNYGALPDGLQFVKREERYTPDMDMVQMLMSNYKQLMGESTSSYTQDIDEGTSKERTAFEVQALLTQTAKFTGSILNNAYEQSVYEYTENCRRLTCKDSPDFTAKKFIARCRELGVDQKWLDVTRWEIEPERVLGQGNMQLEQAQAKALLDIRPLLDTTGQDYVTNKYVFSVTHDPKLTDHIASLDKGPKVTDSMHDTELVFSAFMNGTAVKPRPGTNAIDVVETMLTLMEQTIQGMVAGGGMGTPDQIHGLAGCILYTRTYLVKLAQDPTQKDRVKQYEDRLGKIENMVKAFEQRQQQAAEAAEKEAAKQQEGASQAEMMANIQAKMAETQVKIQGKKAMDAMKLDIADKKFQGDQQRKNLEALGQVQRDTMLATVDAGKLAQEDDGAEGSE